MRKLTYVMLAHLLCAQMVLADQPIEKTATGTSQTFDGKRIMRVSGLVVGLGVMGTGLALVGHLDAVNAVDYGLKNIPGQISAKQEDLHFAQALLRELSPNASTRLQVVKMEKGAQTTLAELLTKQTKWEGQLISLKNQSRWKLGGSAFLKGAGLVGAGAAAGILTAGALRTHCQSSDKNDTVTIFTATGAGMIMSGAICFAWQKFRPTAILPTSRLVWAGAVVGGIGALVGLKAYN